MKAVVIHAVHWNERKYVGAGGFPGGTGYVKEKGYGHEEWNNNPKWRTRERATGVLQRLIFTNANSAKLRKFIAEGNELAIAMVATHHGRKDLVGIACDVQAVDKGSRKELGRTLHLRREYERVWKEVREIRDFFEGNRSRFQRQIRKDQDYFRWSAPSRYFTWFDPPITVESDDLLDTDQITHRFGGSQGIEPEALIEVLKVRLSKKSPILDWLREGEFSDTFISRRERPNGRTRRAGAGNRSAGKKFRVCRLNAQYEVFPHHSKLQGAFVRWIEREFRTVKATPNWRYVDVRLDYGKANICLAEVKPCNHRTVRFAVREAIGQLLEYRYRHAPRAKVAVVLDIEPGTETLSLLKSVGIAAMWRNRSGFEGTLSLS